MAKKSDARKRLEQTRAKLAEWEAAADKAARDLSRYRRPDLVKKAERRGRMAEKKLREYAKQERDLTRRVARADRRNRDATPKRQREPGKWVYHPKVSYARQHHNATVEISFHRRDFARMSNEEVQDALHDLVKQKERSDIVVSGVMYGQLDADRKGQARDIRAFIGIVLSGNLETIGEEKKP
jgi:hypothetical protein